ncbi:hypothetical protein ILUMI_14079 [Ignelater luminosus]|uniref:Uncharacterized protein n=1 Tax=Ignelater luminosus TaxID=2038154 RepID=A0A8K0GAB3_IGNLU|nr:hypothetical protein ILUMI_14079 [Ignelater luminosus]
MEKEYEEKKIAAINIKKNLNKASKQKKMQDETSDEDEVDKKELCQESRESDVDFDVEDEDHEIKLGDFVLVKFATKKNMKHFMGRVEKILSVNFLKKDKNNKFTFPNEPDINDIMSDDIITKVPAKNRNFNSTVRKTRISSFDVDFLHCSTG